MLRKLWKEFGRTRDVARPPAMNTLAEVAAALARGDPAAAASRLAAPADATYPAAACRLGEDHLARGEYAAAIDCFFRALRSDQHHAPARAGLGTAYLEQGDLEEAMLQLTLARRLRPGDGRSTVHQGQIQLAWSNLELAALALEEGLALDPNQPRGWNDLGIVRQRFGDLVAAAACFRRAAALRPDFATALANLGLALRELERTDEACASLARAVDLRPDSPDNHVNLGTVLQDAGDAPGAEREYRRALEIDPGHPEALLGLGAVCQRRGELETAQQYFERALAVRADFAAARTALGEVRLSRGEFEPGWRDYESRLAAGGGHRLPIAFPEWSGAAMPQGTLLVYWEQGLGDIVLFASCLAEAAARVGQLVVEVPPALEHLFARSFPDAVITTKLRAAPAEELGRLGRIDAAVAIGSLMPIFRSASGAFPRHRGYLTPDPARVASLRDRLAGLGGRVFALSWRGGLARTGRGQRSLDLAALRPLCELPGVSWVSLQYGAPEAELAAFHASTGLRVHHWPEVVSDLDEAAALIAATEAVVSVCNTSAHLAGALGAPVAVLAPVGVSWRYQSTGTALPWYPSATVFRQRRPGDWGAVIADVARAIRAGGFPEAVNAR